VAQVRVNERKFASALLSAKRPKEVFELLRMAEGVYGPLSHRPVGDRPNNIGTIRFGSDPALGLVERVTNAMDAMLDLGRLQNPGGTPGSPREAASKWYGIPAGGLAEMPDTQRRALGEKIQVSLEESGISKRPTVVVVDEATGVSGKHFPKTLVSLNEQNKVNQPWTMGTYGQGGAVTFGFCEATVIISRCHPELLDGEEDRIAWTVVQRHEDYNKQALPSFKYVVGPDNQVMTMNPSLFPHLKHGTIVIHVAYDLQGWTGPFTTGIWQFFHAALFDPVLPFLITSHRKKDEQYGSRIVIGNSARLGSIEKAKGDIELAHKDSTTLNLEDRYGSVLFNYWVVRRPATSTGASDPAAGYVQPATAVSITLFGQRQDAEERRWIKDNAMLPFLYKNMIVQLSADDLTPVAKGELFTSTRERGTKSDIRTTIYEKLAEVLRTDDELKRLNQEEKERVLQKSTSASSEKVRKRLAMFIKTHLKNVFKPGKASGQQGNEGKRKRPPGGTSPPRDISDEHLPKVPTKLEFLARNKAIRVYRGAAGYTWVAVNAKNGYLPSHNDDLTLTWEGGQSPGDNVRLTMRSKLLGGESRWFFEAEADAPIGDYTFKASLVTPNGMLFDELNVSVREATPAKPQMKGKEPETGPRVEWVYKDAWDEMGFTPRTVGRVDEDQEETIIWVNRHYHLLERSLSGRNLTPDAIETRATRYQFPVACALWLQQDAVKRAEQKPSEDYLQAESERMAEAVLVAIDPDVDVALEEGEA
jgi:hypothetical protein